MNCGVKKPLRRRMLPVLDFRTKLNTGQMAQDSCHDNLAIAPLSTKVEIKRVVLDVLIPRVGLGRDFSWK
jgi:hypothetical protein